MIVQDCFCHFSYVCLHCDGELQITRFRISTFSFRRVARNEFGFEMPSPEVCRAQRSGLATVIEVQTKFRLVAVMKSLFKNKNTALISFD